MPFGFPLRPTSPSTVGRLEVAQIQARCFRTCVGSQTPGAPARLAYRRAGYCLPPAPTASAPPTDIDCEARCPSLCLPLSTLRPQPRGCQRMTQGRGGLLGLPRMALSSTTLLLAHWRLPGLNTRPAHAPANASLPASRLAPHSSGPVWIATPSPYKTFTRCTAPPYPAHTHSSFCSASNAQNSRNTASRLGKMPTTALRRLSSLFKRSSGLVE